ncbi:antitoxin VbhA family protein [Melghirimyces profundicolus]|uniref:antitoxin VbhA family protein n=1 Tax=Melghirimyces profundicolus TaxID=1242148 RepID=UPI0014736201
MNKTDKAIRYAVKSVSAEGPPPSREAIEISSEYLRGEISEKEALKRLRKF